MIDKALKEFLIQLEKRNEQDKEEINKKLFSGKVIN